MELALEINRSQLGKLAVLIPARKPGELFAPLVQSLSVAGFAAVIVIDDGSGMEFRALFDTVAKDARVHLLRHAVNLGKGRALKTGINHFLDVLSGCEGLLTADADGQHSVEDIIGVAEAFLNSDGRVVLGARTFSREVPLRSRFGNQLTRKIFGFVTGKRLLDTQTGLRVLPRPLLPALLPLEGEGYEYEITALLHVCRLPAPPLEVPIQTIYLDKNRSSHFDPIRDSMRIYFVLLRFYLSSMIAAGIDFAGFTAAFWVTGNVLASLVFGRLSSLVNFSLNKKFVFNSRASLRGSLWRYYLLVAAIGSLAYGSIRLLETQLHWNVFLAKLFVDTTLSLVSFSVQRTFVFRERAELEKQE